MEIILITLLLLFMIILAGLHIYWGHGGLWPGKDKQDLIDKVYGEGSAFPSITACYAVAVLLLIAGLLPFFSLKLLPSYGLWQYFSYGNYIVAFVFLVRGIAGLFLFNEKSKTKIFVYYNRIIYSPLTIVLGLVYLYFAVV